MQKIYLFIAFFCLSLANGLAQTENQKEFDTFIQDLKGEFIYLEEKKDLIDCIAQTYRPYVDTVSSSYFKVLFYEQVMNEFYDSHMHLNSNTGESYRLSSPLYAALQGEKFIVQNVFASQLDYRFEDNILGAEILSFNGKAFADAVDDFPTLCHNKKDPAIREWLANKVLSGKLNEARTLGLKLVNGKQVSLDIDALKEKSHTALLEATIQDKIGIIRINNSLGNSDLVAAFNEALDGMMDTRALILDLRNTPGGGNTGVAEPIMGRFINARAGYQVCENAQERYTRYVMPTGQTYTRPVYVLAGRWTGSMGEGMTIGLDGMNRATIVGTELERLAGGMKTVNLANSNFGFRVSFEKMYHLDGRLRETFVPKEYVEQKTVTEDEFLRYALDLISRK